jgi:hypothetical protein
MNTLVSNTANWYLRMLLPLSDGIKLTIISKLTAAMSKKEKKEEADSHFFDGLTGAWNDGTSPEEEIEKIRSARTSGLTRKMENWIHRE